MSAAPVASTFSQNIQIILNGLGIHLPLWATAAYNAQAHTYFDLIAAAIVIAFGLLVAVGVKESTGTNAVLVVIKMSVLAFFVLIALPHFHIAHFTPFAPHGWRQPAPNQTIVGIIPGAFYAFFAFIGFDAVTVAAEEAKRPQRDVPIGVLGSLALGTLFYTAVAVALIGLQPAPQINSNTPLPTALAAVGLGQYAWTAILGALLGTSSVILTAIYGQSRIFMVMARDGLLPKGVAAISQRLRTPARMTIIMSVVIAILAGYFNLDTLLSFVNTGTLSAFMLVCLGIIILRYTQPDRPRPFRTPLVPLVPALGTIMSAMLMFYGTDMLIWIRFGVWMLVGLVLYFAYGYWHSEARKAAWAKQSAKVGGS